MEQLSSCTKAIPITATTPNGHAIHRAGDVLLTPVQHSTWMMTFAGNAPSTNPEKVLALTRATSPQR